MVIVVRETFGERRNLKRAKMFYFLYTTSFRGFERNRFNCKISLNSRSTELTRR